MGFEQTQICLNCGKKWDIYKVSLPARDKDSLECDCGETLRSWNGGVMFTAQPSKKE